MNETSLATSLFKTFLTNYNLDHFDFRSFCDRSRKLITDKTFQTYVSERLKLLESLHNFGVVLSCIHGKTPLYWAFYMHQSQACFVNFFIVICSKGFHLPDFENLCLTFYSFFRLFCKLDQIKRYTVGRTKMIKSRFYIRC